MTILSHVLAVIFGFAVAWWLDHFVFPSLGRFRSQEKAWHPGMGCQETVAPYWNTLLECTSETCHRPLPCVIHGPRPVVNRTIKVSRFSDTQTIRIEIYADIHAAPVEALSCTPDEAIELHAILGLFQFNNWIASVTGFAAPPIIPAEWRSDPRKGGAS